MGWSRCLRTSTPAAGVDPIDVTWHYTIHMVYTVERKNPSWSVATPRRWAMDLVPVTDVCEYIQTLKVAELKEHIKEFNGRLPFCPHMRLSGNKNDLVQRLTEAVVMACANIQSYQEMLAVIRPLGFDEWCMDHVHLRRAMSRYRACYGCAPTADQSGHDSAALPSMTMRSAATDAANPMAWTAPTQGLTPRSLKQLRFWSSPFYEVLEFVSSIVQVPEAPPSTGRRQVGMSFTLSQQQVDQLRDTQHLHQLRLFCTTFDHFMASVSPSHQAAPVEFPFTCDARINDHSLNVNLRGNKKHAGRVSPPNLNRNGHLSMQPGKLNRVELSYANSPARHTMVVALCKITTAEYLTEQLKLRRYRSKEAVMAMMREKAKDEDIETGASTLKLTCPLTYMRMSIPCRSNTCDHIQCFDALSFYSMNEQSPQWQCPVCSKDIRSEDLHMDGYVEDILRRVPADCEAVLVESDGTWHTADDQYHTDSPFIKQPVSAPPLPMDDDDTPDNSPMPSTHASPPHGFAQPKEELATPPVTPSIPISVPPPESEAPPPSHVIDLTLSSDEDM